MRYGKPELAVDSLKKAIARQPDATEFQVNYAMALARTGDKAAARAEMRRLVGSGKAVSLEPEAKALLDGR